MRRRGRRVLAAVSITAAFGLAATEVGAGGPRGSERSGTEEESTVARHRQRIPVTWTRSPDPTTPRTTLPPFCLAENQCLVAVQTGGLLSGDLVGSTFTLTAASGVPGGAGAAGTVAIFTITESPCGAGTLVFANYAVGVPGQPGWGRWEIVAGAGTSELTNVAGTGRTAINPDGTAEFTGRIRCDTA